jgi:lipopolysaccharide/colanic/teichoic acid biosynthesis glycosyltransferase
VKVDSPVASAPPRTKSRPDSGPSAVARRSRPVAVAAKRGLDLVGATVLLLVLAPLLVMVSLAVKLGSGGPVLFRQPRLGRGLEPFTVLKFRTMRPDASPDVHRDHIARLAGGTAPAGPQRLTKLVEDPRVTGVGRVLRRLSLDELPQLVNVLRGEMSLVGPRPAIEYELDHYAATDFDRFLMRPGMTGLWQVSGRSELGFREMLDLDVSYVRHWSLALDAKILARTPFAVLRGSA